MKKNISSLILLLTILVLNFMPALALAATTPTNNQIALVTLPDELHPKYAPVIVLKEGNEADYGNYFFQLIAGGLLYLAGPVAIAVIAIGGVRYITAHGDQTQMEGAKKTIEWAIIGLIVIIFSWAIIKAIIGIVVTKT